MKNEVEESALPDFSLSLKLQSSGKYQYNDKQFYKWDRIESPELEPQLHGFSTKVASNSLKKRQSFPQVFLG